MPPKGSCPSLCTAVEGHGAAPQLLNGGTAAPVHLGSCGQAECVVCFTAWIWKDIPTCVENFSIKNLLEIDTPNRKGRLHFNLAKKFTSCLLMLFVSQRHFNIMIFPSKGV